MNKPAFAPLSQLWTAARHEIPAAFITHYVATLGRWLVLFVSGIAIGIPTGIVLGYYRTLYAIFHLDVEFFRSLPATALVVFVMAAFGDNELTRTLPALYITTFTVLYYVARHARILNQDRIQHLEDFGASSWFILRHCIYYELLPTILIAVRQAVSLSFLVLVSVEIIVGPSANRGIGRAIYDWQFNMNYAAMIVGLLVIGAIGYGLNTVMAMIQSAAIRWEDGSNR